MDLVAQYHAIIEQILASTHMSDKLIHVHVGMAIYMLAQIVFRTRRGSLDALTVVFALEALNETMDRLYSGSWHWADTAGDFASTMFWPVVLVLHSQYRRRRWARMERHRQFLKQFGLNEAQGSQRQI